jgi:hypothetical protein
MVLHAVIEIRSLLFKSTEELTMVLDNAVSAFILSLPPTVPQIYEVYRHLTNASIPALFMTLKASTITTTFVRKSVFSLGDRARGGGEVHVRGAFDPDRLASASLLGSTIKKDSAMAVGTQSLEAVATEDDYAVAMEGVKASTIGGAVLATSMSLGTGAAFGLEDAAPADHGATSDFDSEEAKEGAAVLKATHSLLLKERGGLVAAGLKGLLKAMGGEGKNHLKIIQEAAMPKSSFGKASTQLVASFDRLSAIQQAIVEDEDGTFDTVKGFDEIEAITGSLGNLVAQCVLEAERLLKSLTALDCGPEQSTPKESILTELAKYICK